MNKETIRYAQFLESYPKANVSERQFGYARATFARENGTYARACNAKEIIEIVYRQKKSSSTVSLKAFFAAVNEALRWSNEIHLPAEGQYNHFHDND